MILCSHRVGLQTASAAAVAVVALLAGRSAQAQTFDGQVSGQVNFGAPPPVYTQPQPVYAQPVYAEPQPVYVQQQPVYSQQPVYGQPVMVRRSYYVHDGFFLRGAIGLGYSYFSASNSVNSNTLALSGLSVNADLAAGFVVAPNLAIHLSLDYAGMYSPTVSQPGFVTVDASGTTYSSGLLGVGATLWLAPANFFISASVGAALMSASLSSSTTWYDSYGGATTTTGTTTVGQSNVGLGVNAMAGWDFPLSSGWALGLAGQFMYSRIPDSDGKTTWNNLTAGALVQLTNY